MGTTSLTRIIFDSHGGAKTAERWNVGHRIRDVEEGPDGSLWMLEDANPGALFHVAPNNHFASSEEKQRAGSIRLFGFAGRVERRSLDAFQVLCFQSERVRQSCHVNHAALPQ
jgi:hypothetical protein